MGKCVGMPAHIIQQCKDLRVTCATDKPLSTAEWIIWLGKCFPESERFKIGGDSDIRHLTSDSDTGSE